jgi:hypothetical protein
MRRRRRKGWGGGEGGAGGWQGRRLAHVRHRTRAANGCEAAGSVTLDEHAVGNGRWTHVWVMLRPRGQRMIGRCRYKQYTYLS